MVAKSDLKTQNRLRRAARTPHIVGATLRGPTRAKSTTPGEIVKWSSGDVLVRPAFLKIRTFRLWAQRQGRRRDNTRAGDHQKQRSDIKKFYIPPRPI